MLIIAACEAVRTLLAVLFAATLALAQATADSEAPSDIANKFWLSGQLNIVTQVHPSFYSAYSGPNSFHSNAEIKPTGVATIYTGYALSRNTEFFFDVEAAHGSGVSGALGLGGLGNLDATTDKGARAVPYIARAMVRQIVPLSKEMVEGTPNPLGLAPKVPARRLEFRLGKMSLTDFFDLNAVGSDSHLQFLNYSIDNNSAYDIAPKLPWVYLCGIGGIL